MCFSKKKIKSKKTRVKKSRSKPSKSSKKPSDESLVEPAPLKQSLLLTSDKLEEFVNYIIDIRMGKVQNQQSWHSQELIENQNNIINQNLQQS